MSTNIAFIWKDSDYAVPKKIIVLDPVYPEYADIQNNSPDSIVDQNLNSFGVDHSDPHTYEFVDDDSASSYSSVKENEVANISQEKQKFLNSNTTYRSYESFALEIPIESLYFKTKKTAIVNPVQQTKSFNA